METKQLIANLAARNIHAQFLPGLSEAKAEILSMLPDNVSVGIGNSQTIKAMNLTDTLLQKGYTVYDKTLASSREESKSLKKQALLAQWYISGSNAIALDGRIVNIDHSGNRAAALTFGPDYVIIVVGVKRLPKVSRQPWSGPGFRRRLKTHAGQALTRPAQKQIFASMSASPPGVQQSIGY
ncbi:MAG: hypothetical protein FH749_06660 [Firmicutes bacterium]|nr:hypothetical protein [Bacillota bacterium]